MRSSSLSSNLQSPLISARILELQSELSQSQAQHKQLQKHVGQLTQLRSQLCTEFENHKAQTIERLNSMNEIVEQLNRQIVVLKNSLMAAQSKSKDYEEELRKTKQDNIRLLQELTDKQAFINGYLKKIG